MHCALLSNPTRQHGCKLSTRTWQCHTRCHPEGAPRQSRQSHTRRHPIGKAGKATQGATRK
eukprot:8941138-Alexandrium_andersonii.AAC.1